MQRKNIISGLLWTFGFKVLSSIIQIGTLAVLGRLLTAIDFGTMGILLMIVGFSKIFSEFGLGAAIVQKQLIDVNDKRAVLFASLIISAIFTLVFFLTSENVARYFNNEEINFPLKVISFVFIIDALVVSQIAVAQKQMKFKFIANTTFFAYLFGNSIITIILAYLSFGVWSLVLGYISSSLITLFLYIGKFGIITPIVKLQTLKQLFSFASYFTIGRIANYFANNGDYFIIGKVLGAESLGFYSRAYRLMSAPANLLGSTLQKILFPVFSELQNNEDTIKKYFLIANSFIGYLSLISTVAVIFYAENIVNTILGPGWELTVFPLKTLTLGLIFKLGYKITTPIMNATGLVKIRSIIEILYLVFIISCTLIGSFWGINGASVGVLAAIILNFITSNIYCIKYLNIGYYTFIKQYTKPLLVSSSFLIALFIKHYSITYFLIYIVISFLVYLILLRANIFKEEIQILKKLRK